MIIKPTKTKKEALIKQRMQNLLDSGREIDTELFAKNIGESLTTIDKLVNELLTEKPNDYEKDTKSVQL